MKFVFYILIEAMFIRIFIVFEIEHSARNTFQVQRFGDIHFYFAIFERTNYLSTYLLVNRNLSVYYLLCTRMSYSVCVV